MKTYYTANEIQRIATEKAIEILNKDKEMMLNNTSYGGGRFDVLIGLTNTTTRWRNKIEKTIFIALDRIDWRDDTINLSIYEYIDGEYKQIEIINTFYEIRTIKGTMYLTNKDDYERHIKRLSKRDNKKPKEMTIKINTPLNEKLRDSIQRKTSKKIKEQEFTVTKLKHGYSVNYIYRNVQNNYIKKYQ